MIHFSLRQLMEHQQKKVKVNIFGYIFHLCDSVNLSRGDNTGEKPQPCLAILWKASKWKNKSASRVARTPTPGSNKKTSPKLRVKKLGKI